MKHDPLIANSSVMYKSLLAAALAFFQLGTHAASQAPVAAENGMVVTAQHLATHVGVDILKSGGNAVDAAVAVGYALAVVYPAAGNIGFSYLATSLALEPSFRAEFFLSFRVV